MKGWVALSNLLKVVEHKSQKASECTIYLHCFQHFLCQSKYRIKTCHIARVSVLVFIISYSSKSFQIPQECMLKIHFFKYFSEVLNRFKYRHNACFRCTLFSSISLQFQIVSDTTRMHALETLFSHKNLHVHIVSDTTRMHALEKLFSHKKSACPYRFRYHQNACFREIVFIQKICMSISFQIPPECMLQRHCFHTQNLHVHIVSDTTRMHALNKLYIKLSLQFQIISNTVRMLALETLFTLFFF